MLIGEPATNAGTGEVRPKTGRVLVPVDEQQRREDTVIALAMCSDLMAQTVNPDAPFRYDPPVPAPVVLTLHDQEKRTYGCRVRAVATQRRHRRWGRK